MQNVRPAAANGGHRDILISGFRPHQKNSLKAFFTATLPSGMVLHNLTLHEREGVRWIGLPAQSYVDEQGQRQFTRIIEFATRASADKFRDEILAALDRHLAGARQ